MSLKRKFKISSRSRIGYIYKKGTRFMSGFFQFRHLPNRFPFPRFSLLLPQKITNKATERNKLRRKIYEAIRCNFGLCLPPSKKTCYDVVVLYRGRDSKTPYAEIEKDIIHCMKKLNQ